MKNYIVFLLLLIFISISVESVENPKEFIEKVLKLKPEERVSYIEKKFPMLRYNYEFPYIQGENVLFVYKGIADKVKLVGDMTFWINDISLEKIEGTDLFYKEMTFPENARIEYRYDIDNALLSDFLNKKIVLGKYGTNSLLMMKDYQENLYFEKKRGKLLKKSLKTTDNREHNLYIYLPKYYDNDNLYKALYFYNGIDYLNNSDVLRILDRLNAKGADVIGVFIDNDLKEAYYKDIDDYDVLNYGDDIVSFVENGYSVADISEYRYLVAYSENVPFVMYMLSKRPDRYKYIFTQSADFTRVSRPFWNKLLSNNKIKIYMISGEYEISEKRNRMVYEKLMKNRSVDTIIYEVLPQGHSWKFWNNQLEKGIAWMLEN